MEKSQIFVNIFSDIKIDLILQFLEVFTVGMGLGRAQKPVRRVPVHFDLELGPGSGPGPSRKVEPGQPKKSRARAGPGPSLRLDPSLQILSYVDKGSSQLLICQN